MVLSAYFYGYLLTQILGGFLAFKLGGKRVLSMSMLVAAIFTLIIPPCARWSYIALFICRFIVGLAHVSQIEDFATVYCIMLLKQKVLSCLQGVFWPAVASMWSQWAPTAERSRLCGMASAGSWVGNIVALPLASFLCVNGFDGGWASIFYIFGILTLIWSIGFFLLASDTPSTHRFISNKERDYIIRETKKSTRSGNQVI